MKFLLPLLIVLLLLAAPLVLFHDDFLPGPLRIQAGPEKNLTPVGNDHGGKAVLAPGNDSRGAGNEAPRVVAPLAVQPPALDAAPASDLSEKKADPPEFDAQGRRRFVKGEILLRLKEGVREEQLAGLHQAMGNQIASRVSRFRMLKIKLAPQLSEGEAISRYLASGLVEVAERNGLRYPNASPNDPRLAEQYGMNRIQAPAAWDITTGSAEVLVAVLDTGVDYFHPDLAANIWINQGEIPDNQIDDDHNGYVDDVRGWDFGDNDADPFAYYEHGTHVAGIIGAIGNNGIGGAGLNWQVRLMALKISSGTSSDISVDAEVAGIAYAIAKGARVVNCSFGGTEIYALEREAFEDLEKAGILAVCAAGNAGMDNDGATPEYPASFPLENIISVAGSDSGDNLASHVFSSNYGLTSVDLMAPGEGILSTVGSGTTASVKVTATNAVFSAVGMEFAGVTTSNGITATLYDSGKGCPYEFPVDVQGYIALIERGNESRCSPASFYFSEKTANAMSAGAIGVVIYNNNNDSANDTFDIYGGSLQSAGSWPPVVSVRRSVGLTLKSLGNNPVVVLKNELNSSSYGYLSGTSMATPHVVGAAALLLSLDLELDYHELRTAILEQVDPVAGVQSKLVTGGRLNVFKSLQSVCTLTGDLSCADVVGLDDAIFFLQLMAGKNPAVPARKWQDLNGDQNKGLAEAFFILQRIAGLR